MGFFDRFRAPPPRPEPRLGEHSHRHAALVLDHLALLHPDEPDEVRVLGRLGPGGPRVDQLAVALAGAAEAPAFADDAPTRVALLASAARGLWTSLGLPDEGPFELRAGRSGVTVGGLDIPVDPKLRIHGPELLAWLRRATPAFAATQARLQGAMGEGAPEWDRRQARLTIGERSLRAEVLGSFAPAEQSWCWAWANRGLAEVEQAAIRAVRDAAALPMLARPGFACTEPFAFFVAAAAAEPIGSGFGVWRWPQRSGAQLFFAVALG